MRKGFLKANKARAIQAIQSIVLGLLVVAMSACGQRGALVLPSDQAAKDNKAIYLIKPKKANGEPQPTPQTDFIDQPTSDLDGVN